LWSRHIYTTMDKPEANLLDLLAGVDVRALSRHLAVLAEQQGPHWRKKGRGKTAKRSNNVAVLPMKSWAASRYDRAKEQKRDTLLNTLRDRWKAITC